MNRPRVCTEGVCIVNVGAATSIGMTAPSTMAAVRAGIANFTDHSDVVDPLGEPSIVASAPYLDDNVPGDRRLVELATRAILETLLLIDDTTALRGIHLPTFVGLPEMRPGVSSRLSETMEAQLLKVATPKFRVSSLATFPDGHSAGLMAIDAAIQMLQSGQAEFCLAGGVDSYLDRDSLKWVDDCEQLHYRENAWGFIPGEAASFCLLCSPATAKRYQFNVLGHVLGVAIAYEENRIKTETVCIGKGLTTAVTAVLDFLPSAETQIDHWICDMNGDAYRADEIGFMLTRTSTRFVNASEFTAPADCWGDVGAASGPLFLALACAKATKGYAEGPVTLLLTSSEGGARGAALFLANTETP